MPHTPESDSISIDDLLETAEMVGARQDISNALVDLAYYVRADASEARGQLWAAEDIVKKLRDLYDKVGDP